MKVYQYVQPYIVLVLESVMWCHNVIIYKLNHKVKLYDFENLRQGQNGRNFCDECEGRQSQGMANCFVICIRSITGINNCVRY